MSSSATSPAATWRIPLSAVEVSPDLVDAACEAVRSEWWSSGPRVEALEAEIAARCNTKHAIAVANGTAALQLALGACGVVAGDEVVMPSLNFVAAANAAAVLGAEPVFCDVKGPCDPNLDPDDLAAAIGPRTKAVVALHYGGFPCDMEAVSIIAERRGLAVIEDAAHAIGASLGKRPCGSLGDVGCFSFFANKNVPIGEGGAIATDDDEIARSLRLLRSHGMTTMTWDRHRGHASTYDVLVPGYNHRLDEIRAALARVQLERLDERNVARATLAARYRNGLEGSDVIVPFAADGHGSAHHIQVCALPEGTDRALVREDLARAGVQTSVHYPPIHRFSAYRDRGRRRPLPNTEELAERLLTLPLHPLLTVSDVDEVVGLLRDAVAQHRAASS